MPLESSFPLSERKKSFQSMDRLSQTAQISQLDQYIESFYENGWERINASQQICQLVSDERNISILLQNDSLLSILTRTLNEEARKDFDLANNILYFFYTLSFYPQIMPTLNQYKIGDQCFKAIEREIDRYHFWLRQKKQEKSIQLISEKQDLSLYFCFNILQQMSQNQAIEVKMMKRDLVHHCLQILSLLFYKKEQDAVWQSVTLDLFSLILEMLNRFCLYQENIETLSVLAKQQPQFILSLIEKLIQQSFEEQIESNIWRWLCLLAYNKDLNILLSSSNEIVSGLAKKMNVSKVKELVNLLTSSLDSNHEIFSFHESDLIAIVMKMFLETPSPLLASIVLNLCQSETNCLIICGKALNGQAGGLGLKILVKNAISSRNIYIWKILQKMSQTQNKQIQEYFLNHLDTLLISSQNEMEKLMKAINEESSESIIFVKCMLNILTSLRVSNFDYMKLCTDYPKILEFLSHQIQLNLHQTKSLLRNPNQQQNYQMPPGILSSDDLLLDCIMLLGTMAQDSALLSKFSKLKFKQPAIINQLPSSARPSAASGKRTLETTSSVTFQSMILECCRLKQEDPEILLHSLYFITKLLYNKDTKDYFLDKSIEIVPLFMDFLCVNSFAQIRTMASDCLEIVEDQLWQKLQNQPSDNNETDLLHWLERIKLKRFQKRNSDWMKRVKDSIIKQYQQDPEKAQRLLSQMHLKETRASSRRSEERDMPTDDDEDDYINRDLSSLDE